MSPLLPPEQRIRKRQTFQRLYLKGKLVRGKFLNIWAYEQRPAETESMAPKLGVVVSKKVSLRANVRNRFKRLIKETFRLKQDMIKQNIELLVQAKRKEPTPTYQQVSDEFEGLLAKLECLRN